MRVVEEQRTSFVWVLAAHRRVPKILEFILCATTKREGAGVDACGMNAHVYLETMRQLPYC